MKLMGKRKVQLKRMYYEIRRVPMLGLIFLARFVRRGIGKLNSFSKSKPLLRHWLIYFVDRVPFVKRIAEKIVYAHIKESVVIEVSEIESDYMVSTSATKEIHGRLVALLAKSGT